MVLKYYKDFLAALLIAGVGVYGTLRYLEVKELARFKAERQVLMTALNELQDSYHQRGQLIRTWSKLSSVADRAETRVLLSENDGLQLAQAVEMERFEAVQERLNLLTSKWTADKKMLSARPTEFIAMDRALAQKRQTYSAAALGLNARACKKCKDLVLPVFPAERQFLSLNH